MLKKLQTIVGGGIVKSKVYFFNVENSFPVSLFYRHVGFE